MSFHESKRNNEYSVLMAVYKNDNPEYLELAIDSMTGQSITPEQIVIVIDGPIGSKLEKVIDKYQLSNPELFTIVRLSTNGGLGNALNIGLKECRNELVARMDADDISFQQRCEKQIDKFNSNPNLCILGTQIYEFIGTIDNIVSSRKVPCDFETIKKFAKRRSPFNHPTVMYKRSIIEKIGGYPTLNRKEDLSLFIKAVSENYYSENLKETLLFYRTSVENQERRRTWTNCKEYIQVMYGFFKKGTIGVGDLLYVVIGQTIMFIAPPKVVSFLNNKYLRNKYNN